MAKYTQLNDQLYQYLLDHSLREHPVLAELREETARMARSEMQIAPDQGQFMQMLIRISGCTRVLEIGTFTGYSALAMALALPEDGRVTACDVSEEWTSIGKKYWEKAGVDKKIDLRIAPASETLDKMISKGQDGSFDLAFIDADKSSYAHYIDQCHILLRPGGVILLDNVLWEGKVVDPTASDEDTMAFKKLNPSLLADERFDLSMLAISDGLTLLRKR